MKTDFRYQISRLALWMRRGSLLPIRALERLHAWAFNEILWRTTTPAIRARLNREFYATQAAYQPGARFFEEGLFAWERAALAHPAFPKSGHIAVFCAGGGREVRALRAMGYAISAFEPNPDFSSAARAYFRQDRGVTWTDASSEAFARKEVGFSFEPDGVIVGWGGASYLLETDDRLRFFQALRERAPRAPVLLSYLMHPRPDHWIARARGLSSVGPFQAYLDNAGFAHLYSRPALRSLADRSGYTIVLEETEPYPFSLWKPA